jgi:ribosomal protein S18 acetylase RimI-like enzyme
MSKSENKKRRCPECKHWDFDDQTHWCKKDYLRLTYTSLTLPIHDRNILDCEDFEPFGIKKKSNTKTDEDFIQNRFGYCFYEIDNDSCILYNLYVKPEYRRKGHAKKLVKLVIDEIRERGYKGDIETVVSPKEKSISIKNLTSFYIKMGIKILNEKFVEKKRDEII